MKTRKKKAFQELKRLSRYVSGKVTYENGIQVLKVSPSLGTGEVRCIYFDDGLIAMEFNIVAKQDITIVLANFKNNVMYFLYCFQGSCFHRLENGSEITKLEELQTAVITTQPKVVSELLIRKEEPLILNLIRLEKKQYIKRFEGDKEGFDTKILELLKFFEEPESHFHLGRLNLEIGELIKLLGNAKYANEFSTLMQFEGICHLILAKHIEQFKMELEISQQQQCKLSKQMLLEIAEVGDFIKNYPEVQHSIDTICRKSGLSAAKLQEGFRFIYQMTVGEFVRDARLVRAEYLLRTTEMNVSEVVYSIGFTSRSYFCKIFKGKYRCSPKAYKKMSSLNYQGQRLEI